MPRVAEMLNHKKKQRGPMLDANKHTNTIYIYIYNIIDLFETIVSKF